MTITVVSVGRVRGALAPAVEEYEARAARYWKLEVVEVDDGAPGKDPEPGRIRAAEAERIRARLPERAALWVLTRKGKGITSEGLARYLESRALSGAGDLALVIGGAWGLDESLLAAADRRLSLSPMTLPHELARVMLAEQLYRAGTIRRGEPYHKGG